jgi:hypothetical protein
LQLPAVSVRFTPYPLSLGKKEDPQSKRVKNKMDCTDKFHESEDEDFIRKEGQTSSMFGGNHLIATPGAPGNDVVT